MENEEIHAEEEPQKLFRLDDLDDFEVSDDDPDIRGWDVVGAGNEKLGRVDELIVDPDLMTVRYLDVEMDEEINDNGERHILVPIGIATLDEDDDRVFIKEISKDVLRACPIYTGQDIDRPFEQKIREALHIQQEVVNPEEAEMINEGDTTDAVDVRDADVSEIRRRDPFYEHSHFSEQKFYGVRRVKKVPFVENPRPIRKKQDFTLPPKL